MIPWSRSWVSNCRVASASPTFSVGERLALVAEDARALVEAAGGQGEVAGDDDVVPFDVLDDPVVRAVQTLLHHHQLQPLAGRHAHVTVGDQGHACSL